MVVRSGLLGQVAVWTGWTVLDMHCKTTSSHFQFDILAGLRNMFYCTYIMKNAVSTLKDSSVALRIFSAAWKSRLVELPRDHMIVVVHGTSIGMIRNGHLEIPMITGKDMGAT